MPYTDTWNAAFEASPADGDLVSEGAKRIRDLRTAIRERMEKDHYFAVAGTDADHGEHVKITFNAQSAKPSNVADKGFLYIKDVSAKAELHWEDEDGNELQITSGGSINITLTPYVAKALFDANTILIATTDDTPEALTVAEQRIVGRKTSGNINDLTGQEVKAILGTFVDKGNSGTDTQTLDFSGYFHHKITATGTFTIATSNWPASGLSGEGLLELVNGGSQTITWPTVYWIKNDGTTTTTFSENGVTLQTSGTDWVYLWSRDAGTTIYGKIVR
jgi:hypothetical protein